MTRPPIAAAGSLPASRAERARALAGRTIALALVSLLLGGCTLLSLRREAPPPGRTKLGSPLVILPAETTGNFIIVEARWDKYGPYHFVIDTGSTNTLITPALARRYAHDDPTRAGDRVHVASAEGDIMELPATLLPKLELGAAKFEDVPVLVYDLAQLSAHLGVRIDGLLGFPLFRETRLTLDYPHHRVLLQPANAAALTPGTPVPFEDTHKAPVITIRVGDRSMLALIDSGSDATLSLNPAGVDASFASGPRAGATIGTLGGDHPQQIGRLAEPLQVGDYRLTRPVVDLTDELTAIGGGVLRYFTVTFDPAHDQVTFLRDDHAPIEMPTRRSAGLSFSKTPAYWRVAGVIPDSPAKEAGIQFGDLVTRIEGEPVAKWNLERYEHAVATSATLTFTLLFGTNEVEKRVGVFDLVP
jgi:hypothetical protein